MIETLSRRLLFGAAVVLAAAATPLAWADDGHGWFGRMFGAVTEGSGKLQTETREASAFKVISIKGPLKVVLRQGSREGVALSADDNLLPLIETRVEGNTLHVGPKKSVRYSTRNPVTATIDFIVLRELAVAGSGDVTAPGVKAAALDVAIGGSGSVRFPDLQARSLSLSIGGSGDFETSGRTQKFSVGVGGSGSVRAERLDADDVSVAIGGSGDASVRANKTLDVSVGGSGDVVYSGDAVVKTSIAGAGSIKKR